VESADALRNRNRDQHIKQMLRHWASATAAKRAAAVHESQAREPDDDSPESPSLRPASRAAMKSTFASSPSVVDHLQSTPGYLRTPTRQRRAGRFRPIPTPAAFTPLAFDPAYMATTPAPLPTHEVSAIEGLTPQITPFSRKLRAGGILSTGLGQSSVLRRGELGRSVQGGTGKSVRFARGSRFPPLVGKDS
jgi:protein SFI1